MKVLIVGGAGYLGGALTDLLLETDHEIKVYDNLTYEESYLKPVPFVFGDVRDREKLKEELDWADAVVWLAAIVGDGACAINPVLTKEINQDSVQWLAQNYEGRIIFMSTCSVYGANDEVLDENSPTSPLSVYASTKLEAERHLLGKNVAIFRLGTLFGLGDNFSRVRLDLAVNTMTARAVSEGKLTVFGGEQYRPLLHVKDAAKAALDAVNSEFRGIVNLAKENIKIIDLANKINNLIPVQIETTDMKFEDLRNYRIELNYVCQNLPQHTVEDGIAEIQQLMEEGRIKDPNNRRYSNVGFLTAN